MPLPRRLPHQPPSGSRSHRQRPFPESRPRPVPGRRRRTRLTLTRAQLPIARTVLHVDLEGVVGEVDLEEDVASSPRSLAPAAFAVVGRALGDAANADLDRRQAAAEERDLPAEDGLALCSLSARPRRSGGRRGQRRRGRRGGRRSGERRAAGRAPGEHERQDEQCPSDARSPPLRRRATRSVAGGASIVPEHGRQSYHAGATRPIAGLSTRERISGDQRPRLCAMDVTVGDILPVLVVAALLAVGVLIVRRGRFS